MSGAIPRQAFIGLAAVSADERDAPARVFLDQVARQASDAARIIDGDAANTRLGGADDAGRNPTQAPYQRPDDGIAVAGAHRPLDDDRPLHVSGPGQRVDEVTRVGGRDIAARQAIEVDAPGAALLVGAADDLVLVCVARAPQQQCDARRAAGHPIRDVTIAHDTSHSTTPDRRTPPVLETAPAQRASNRGRRADWAAGRCRGFAWLGRAKRFANHASPTAYCETTRTGNPCRSAVVDLHAGLAKAARKEP